MILFYCAMIGVVTPRPAPRESPAHARVPQHQALMPGSRPYTEKFKRQHCESDPRPGERAEMARLEGGGTKNKSPPMRYVCLYGGQAGPAGAAAGVLGEAVRDVPHRPRPAPAGAHTRGTVHQPRPWAMAKPRRSSPRTPAELAQRFRIPLPPNLLSAPPHPLALFILTLPVFFKPNEILGRSAPRVRRLAHGLASRQAGHRLGTLGLPARTAGQAGH